MILKTLKTHKIFILKPHYHIPINLRPTINIHKTKINIDLYRSQAFLLSSLIPNRIPIYIYRSIYLTIYQSRGPPNYQKMKALFVGQPLRVGHNNPPTKIKKIQNNTSRA